MLVVLVANTHSLNRATVALSYPQHQLIVLSVVLAYSGALSLKTHQWLMQCIGFKYQIEI
jgi:hypothetical protein